MTEWQDKKIGGPLPDGYERLLIKDGSGWRVVETNHSHELWRSDNFILHGDAVRAFDERSGSVVKMKEEPDGVEDLSDELFYGEGKA